MFTVDKLNKFFATWSLDEHSGCGEGNVPEALRAEGTFPLPPPLLSGGLNCQDEFEEVCSVGCDWLTVTVPHGVVIPLCQYLSAMLGGAPEILDHGRWGYDGQATFTALGVAVYFDRDIQRSERVHRGRACVVLPGKVWSLLSGDDCHKLIQDLHNGFWAVGSRVDGAWDDYKRSIEPHALVKACERGCVSGFRRWQHISPRKMVAGDASLREGDMLAFGRRGKSGSGKYLRVYDKGLESDGRNKSIRWEVEFSGAHAKAVFHKLALAPDAAHLASILGALIGGCIRFVERSGNGHIDRMELLPWWADIIKMLGGVSLRRARRVVTVEKTKDWLQDQTASSLAVMQEVMSDDEFVRWLALVIKSGAKRMSKAHGDSIALFRRQKAELKERLA